MSHLYDVSVGPKEIRVQKTFQSFFAEPILIGKILKILHSSRLDPYVVKENKVDDKSPKRIVLRKEMTTIPEKLSSLLNNKIELIPFTVTLDYRDLSLHELLRCYIPEPIRAPSSFETIGHIAHLNLHDNQIPYKYIIGKCILLKNPLIKTVVCKKGQIDNVYRNMNLEVIAGENNFITKINQNSFTFKMDFSKVYWNSRLEHEHETVTDVITPNSVVCDAMCGIGPFSVRAAKLKNCTVYANDLNPDSYVWLKENCKINGVEDKVQCFNIDAREFIVKQFYEWNGCDFIIMNLPGTAIEFLDVIGKTIFDIYHDENKADLNRSIKLPIVIVHSFEERVVDVAKCLQERGQNAFGKYAPVTLPTISLHCVRDISGGKNMYRCVFNCNDVKWE